MVERVLVNIQAVQLFLSSLKWRKGEVPIVITGSDITLKKSVRSILRPLHSFTTMLQDRRASIAVVIPTYVVTLAQLEEPSKEPGVVRPFYTGH